MRWEAFTKRYFPLTNSSTICTTTLRSSSPRMPFTPAFAKFKKPDVALKMELRMELSSREEWSQKRDENWPEGFAPTSIWSSWRTKCSGTLWAFPALSAAPTTAASPHTSRTWLRSASPLLVTNPRHCVLSVSRHSAQMQSSRILSSSVPFAWNPHGNPHFLGQEGAERSQIELAVRFDGVLHVVEVGDLSQIDLLHHG